MIPTAKNDHATVAMRLSDLDKVQEVLKQAAHQAIVEHERSGHKIAVWRDGEVVWEEATIEKEKAR